MSEPHSIPPFHKRVLRALPVIAGMLVLLAIFSHLGVLHQLERLVHDAEMRLNPPRGDGAVAIVNITDKDHEELFQGRSPLSPLMLQKLIAAIAKGEPKLIAIDIDTSSPEFSAFHIDPQWPPVIWERETKELPAVAEETVEVLGVLGRADPAINRQSGLALLIEDSADKVTRLYRPLIPTNQGELPCFACKVAQAAGVPVPEHRDRDLMIEFSGDRLSSHRLKFTAARTLDLSGEWPEKSPIRGNIVLLGGSYGGQDRHDSPLGTMQGLDIQANVIETEIAGGGEPAPNRFAILLLEGFEAFLLIVVFHTMPLRRAILVSLAAIPVFALACSRISFGAFGHWLYFVPILVGLLIYEVYEDYRRKAIPRVYSSLRGNAPPGH